MLRLLSFLLLVPLAACGLSGCTRSSGEAAPHDPAADSLLVHVTGDAWDALFAAPEATYLRTASGEESTRTDSVPNPLPAFLSDEPPFLDAAARDQYQTRIVGDTTVAGRRAQIAEARYVNDGQRKQPVRYVRAVVDGARGQLLAVEVVRSFDSALFAEDSRLIAALGARDGASGARGSSPDAGVESPSARGAGLVLDHATVETTTDVPVSDARRDRIEWRRER